MICYGASLKAFYSLCKKNGYSFVGCNSAGNNAFFVKTELLQNNNIKEISLNEGFVDKQFREARDEFGNKTFFTKDQELKIISKFDLEKVE